MRPIRTAIALAAVLVATAARADDKYPWNYDVGSLAGFMTWIDDATVTFWINTSPVVRAIVCRAAFMDFTLGSLAAATGIPERQLALGVNELLAMGLVRWSRGEGTRVWIQPASEKAREKMREWADDWCASDASCEIGR